MEIAQQATPLTVTGYLARGICTSNGKFSTTPNEQSWYSRALPFVRKVINATDEDKEIYFLPITAPILWSTDGVSTYYPPYMLLAAHSRFYNCGWIATFWAIKSPIAQCRLRLSYVETGHVNTDDRRRRPAVEWDLAASDTCELVIKPSYYFDYKYSVPPSMPDSTVSDSIPAGTVTPTKVLIPKEDYTMGSIKVEIISRYCPGGLFPDSFVLYTFLRPLNMVFNTPVDCEQMTNVMNGFRYI